ncbi:uncharacterized protein B0H64DRAFT_182964 [Chaetomium fimeti]|uniref:Uncharacterized protein n=1 Tax=Chaetomium fimeti TaxID=1854472 RepID=A0AAE0LR00_9PEZI|nr:hypothetical protein B0H64DRAFT_182964 [Chaetomium fimeti]
MIEQLLAETSPSWESCFLNKTVEGATERSRCSKTASGREKPRSSPTHTPPNNRRRPEVPFRGFARLFVVALSSFRPGFRSRSSKATSPPTRRSHTISWVQIQTRRHSIASRASLSNHPGCCEARHDDPSPASTRASICETQKPRHNSSLTTSCNCLPHPTPIAARSRATGIRLGLAHEQLTPCLCWEERRGKNKVVFFLPRSSPASPTTPPSPARPAAQHHRHHERRREDLGYYQEDRARKGPYQCRQSYAPADQQ